MSDFGHIYSFLKGQLFKQYCCSFYGAPLWYFKSDGVEAACVAWQRPANYIYKVHPATHSDIITALSGQMPLLSNLKVCLCKFFTKCRDHNNKIVQAAVIVTLVNPMACTGRYFRKVLNTCYDNTIMYNEWNSK